MKTRKFLRIILIESKKRPWFGCSISWTNKRRSITELNSDSHRQKPIVNQDRRNRFRTLESCGVVPSQKSQRFVQQFRSTLPSNAGLAPAFSCLLPELARCETMHRVLRPHVAGERVTEFISVSGQGTDRSALFSDMRPSKRISGVAAATEHPHAPMNSPSCSQSRANRVSFSTTLS